MKYLIQLLFSRRVGRALYLTVIMALVWYAPLLDAGARPFLISSHILSVTEPTVENDHYFSYPRLGIAAPFIVSTETSPLKVSDWSKIRSALNQGLSLDVAGNDFSSSPLVFLVGHSSDLYPHPYAAVFAGLGQASLGDVVTLTLGTQSYTYTVVQKEVLDPSDVAGFASLRPNDPNTQHLVLVTCWPVLTTKQRLVVVAERGLMR